MNLTPVSYAFWIVGLALVLWACVLAYRRGLQHRLPFFTGYLTIMVASSGLKWIVYPVFGYGSWAAYYFGWSTMALVLAARSLAVGELCFCLLRAYPGVWQLAWRILLVVSLIFVGRAIAVSVSKPYWLNAFVPALERDLELASTAVLISLLIIGRYYTLQMDRLERAVAAGLCICSVSMLMTNAALTQAVTTHPPVWLGYHAWLQVIQTVWNSAQAVFGDVAVIIWIVALRHPVPAVRPVPDLLPESAYRELSPAINFRLRTLNARLLELLKS